MSSFDMSEFDPLNMSAADTYVQSVMVPQKVNEIVTKANVHTEGIVSNLNYSNGRAKKKKRLESDSSLKSVKKLKPTTVDNANDIIRLTDSPQCSKNFVSSEHSSNSNKSDISVLKGLVVGLTAQRILNASLKHIVKAIGEHKLNIKGTVVKPKLYQNSQRGEVDRSVKNTSPKHLENQQDSNAKSNNNDRSRNYNGRGCGRGHYSRGRSQHFGTNIRGGRY
ncbi:unnamed protein product [Mytilus coruscus]|uniref:Uncharacterized protein n=1 Tax=Mytilus coruscus TaxID=42192 RepID=A0A6J8EEJ5_MYTCO|nr:unnamed protein product [Mytilus coruscus]